MATGQTAPVPVWSEATPGAVWAYRFDAAGHAEALDRTQPIRLAEPGDGFLWLHIDLVDVRACRWIGAEPALPATAKHALLSPDGHQRLAIEGEFVCGVVADFIRDLATIRDALGTLHFAFGPRFLLSGRRHALQATEKTRLAIEAGQPVTASVALLELIVVQVADAMGTIIAELAGRIDDIEDRVLDDAIHDDRQQLAPLRRTAVRLHRQLGGLRNLFHRLEHEASQRLTQEVKTTAARLAQRLDALDQEVVAIQERARLLHDEVAAKLAAETNRHLYALSVITALFLPPTLIAGLFGMNTQGLPFTSSTVGFWWALTLGIVAAAGVYTALRRIGILGRR